MAWMNQAKKAVIAVLVKAVMPKGWKYSLSVDNHSTIVCTIKSAPVNLLASIKWCNNEPRGNITLGTHSNFRDGHDFSPEIATILEQIMAALNHNNHDRSVIMTDYFDVGHYVDLRIGKWDAPFIVKE